MKDRLIRLLDSEQLTASKFADKIGVQRSSVSHVLSGRNKPSFDFIQKTLLAFPGLNSDWLILGKGEMITGIPEYAGATLFDVPASSGDQMIDRPVDISIEERIESDSAPEPTKVIDSERISLVPDDRKVISVMLFYDDHTFHSFDPAN